MRATANKPTIPVDRGTFHESRRPARAIHGDGLSYNADACLRLFKVVMRGRKKRNPVDEFKRHHEGGSPAHKARSTRVGKLNSL